MTRSATCIVALKQEEVVYLAADSAALRGWEMRSTAIEKVFRRGPYLFGFCGSFRMGQLLRYALELPERDPEKDLHEFMCTDFVQAVRSCLKESGFARIDHNEESGGEFIVVHEGEVFTVEPDFQVHQTVYPYHAIGCGAQIAMGALFATEGMAPEARLLLAMEAAEEFSNGVRRPFRLVRSDREGTELLSGMRRVA
jgi:20S proteasome alpha/beta subunit